MVGDAVKQAKAEFDEVNAHSFQYQELKREADADKNLYEELVRKIKEASINAGFQNSSIRIAIERGRHWLPFSPTRHSMFCSRFCSRHSWESAPRS